MFGHSSLVDYLDKDRPVRHVPIFIRVSLLLMLAMQLTWHSQQAPMVATAEDLPNPMSARTYVISSLGEPVAMSKVLNLWLQAFDNQPGISIPFRELDYGRVIAWLSPMLELDPRGQYPLLMASQLYSQVHDEARQRQMLAFVEQRFYADPERRWPWLAHGAIVAKHRLHDLPLALRYAQGVARHATGKDVPHWAQQMPIFILEDMGEAQSAKIMLGALLASGSITDPHEIHFLTGRLNALEQKNVGLSSRPSTY
jgi:hypothetical protein